MATLVKTPSGTWKALIRKTGWPTVAKTFRTKRDAEDWSRRTEDEMVRDNDTKSVRECIERLWKVSVIAQTGSKRQGFRLLSEYASDEQNGKLYVALNPMIAHAIMGGQHIRIDMNEVRGLKTDPARLIHQRLCGFIDVGKSRLVELDTLCGYVWPGETKNPNTIKGRRQKARKALVELMAMGWKLDEYAKGKWEIGRPRPTITAPAPR
jgi:hypothetical protein